MAEEPSRYTGGALATNSYLIDTPDGLLVFDAPEGIERLLKHENRKVAALVLTHGHFDHTWDAGAMQEAFGCPVYIHPADADFIRDPEANALFGIEAALAPVREPKLIELPDKGEGTFTVAGRTFRIAHIPGHCPGSVTFYDEANGYVIGGDVLFAGGIGRWDLPGGSLEDLQQGIAQHLLPLPPETVVHPGHGPSTTIGHEAETNPFLGDDVEEFL